MYEDNNNIESNNENRSLKKKNRTLQYYKFLFYSLKTELKVHEFIKTLRAASAGEISLWIISIILYMSTPKDFPKLSQGEKSTSYKNAFIWFHMMHLLRGVIGMILIYTFPRSFQFTNSLETTVDSKLEKSLFNDLIRENIFFNVTEKIKSKKLLVIIYIALTILNFAFDLIDYLIVLASLSDAKSDAKVVLLTYLIIAFLYCVIDLSYFFWGEMLKLHFPIQYLAPIQEAFHGTVKKLYKRFKILKPKTDIKEEDKVQNQGNNNNIEENIEQKLPQINEKITGDNM